MLMLMIKVLNNKLRSTRGGKWRKQYRNEFVCGRNIVSHRKLFVESHLAGNCRLFLAAK